MVVFMDIKYNNSMPKYLNGIFYNKKELIITHINFKNVLKLMKLIDKDLYDNYNNMSSNKAFKIGTILFIEQMKAENLNIEDIIYNLSQIDKQQLIDVGKASFETYKDSIKKRMVFKGNKAFLNTQEYDESNIEILFELLNKIDAILLYNEKEQKLIVVVRSGFETYNKLVFEYAKNEKEMICLDDISKAKASEIFSNLNTKELIDENAYEKDQLEQCTKDHEKIDENVFVQAIEDFVQLILEGAIERQDLTLVESLQNTLKDLIIESKFINKVRESLKTFTSKELKHEKNIIC